MTPELAGALLLCAMFFGIGVPGMAYQFFRKPPRPEPPPTHDTTKTKVIP